MAIINPSDIAHTSKITGASICGPSHLRYYRIRRLLAATNTVQDAEKSLKTKALRVMKMIPASMIVCMFAISVGSRTESIDSCKSISVPEREIQVAFLCLAGLREWFLIC